MYGVCVSIATRFHTDRRRSFPHDEHSKVSRSDCCLNVTVHPFHLCECFERAFALRQDTLEDTDTPQASRF